MNRTELIEKYLNFFERNGHKKIKNHSLIPEGDPTVLFTTAGMHPIVPYLLGQKHPEGKKLTSIQRCIRTVDIEEVGDPTHHTFFEMLGNWSLGDYFKKEAIELSFEFLTNHLNIPKERLAVSVFRGNEKIEKDNQSAEIWENLGIKKEKIAFLPEKNNWWGPPGKTGPCGPDTEIFYWKPNNLPIPKKFNPEDENWVEIWNNVLMQYEKTNDGKYIEAKQKNIDTGMGVERVITILNGYEDNYLSDMWEPIIKKIEEITSKKYSKNEKSMRIIADHVKAACFIINDGISPKNTEQGYVLRRLIRRAIRELNKLGIINQICLSEISKPLFKIYSEYNLNEKKINETIELEEKKFLKTLDEGLKKFYKIIKNKKEINCKETFLLYQSYGFPIEMIEEECKNNKIKFSKEDFYNECKIHQKNSQTACSKKFKSGLADNSTETTKLHTATHLLLAAIKKILNNDKIEQRGSNITQERLRFDFNFERKLTEKELTQIENLVNQEIQKNQKIKKEEMTLKEAKEKGATGIFESKYGEKIYVYSIGNFSKEICSGPHVQNTNELGIFKIIKEESSSAGIRRIKAILK